MAMTITYELGESLYVNVTNKCTNSCLFCVRNTENGIKEDIDLWLDREPTIDEIINSILSRDLSLYKEIVFCGYGEPMMRTHDIVEVCKMIRKAKDIHIRINTNGHANLFYKEDITPLLEGHVDTISISLNAKSSEEYVKICLPQFGEDAFHGLIDFAKKCSSHVPNVVLTLVDVMAHEDIEVCRLIAKEINVNFRIRELIN